MTNVEKFDDWIRGDFKHLNTQLEQHYNTLANPTLVVNEGVALKQELAAVGGELVEALLNEGNTDQGFDRGFDLLGNVGFFMAACRRHEIDQLAKVADKPAFERATKAAAALSLQLGASLGVVPRFASAHLETHNRAINGVYKSFTSLDAEIQFIDFNTRGVFGFIRASQSLLSCLPLGVSHTVTYDLLHAAHSALVDVGHNNQALFEALDTQHFFYNVRPYYKPHYVGLREYRGANAGDFAGINVIDLLLGLCRADDAYYSQLLVDKFLFMRPDDQLVLRDCMRRTSMLDAFLNALESGESNTDWYQRNLKMFLAVCEAHGHTAQQHHDLLIKKFIEEPAEAAELTDQTDLTASGPPLPVMLKGLKKLCDLRTAANVPGIKSRCAGIQKLRSSLLA